MENTKITIKGYNYYISQLKELSNNPIKNRKRLNELKHELSREKEYFDTKITLEKLDNKRNQIQASNSMDKMSIEKNLRKISSLEKQKELYSANEDYIKSILNPEKRRIVARKLNNSGSASHKGLKIAVVGIAALVICGVCYSCGIHTGKDMIENSSKVASVDDTNPEDNTNGNDTDDKDTGLDNSNDDNAKKEDSTEDSKKDDSKKDDSKKDDSKKDDSKDEDSKDNKSDKTNTDQSSSKPQNDTSVTHNDGDNENAQTDKEQSTTVNKPVEKEDVPTEGKLTIEPETVTDNSDIPKINPGKTETTNDNNNNPSTDKVEEGKSDSEKTKFTPDSKESEPEGTRTKYEDKTEEDEESKKQDTTNYTIDETGKSEETTHDIPDSKESEPEGTPRQTPEDKTEEETAPTYVPPVDDDHIVETSNSNNDGWTVIENNSNTTTTTTTNTTTQIENSSETPIITYDETSNDWVNVNTNQVIDENNGTDYDTSNFTFPDDEEDSYEMPDSGKTLSLSL